MRRTLILTLAVLICAGAVCAVGARAVGIAVDGAQALTGQALTAVRLGRTGEAQARLDQLARWWQQRRGTLETLVSHDDLNEVAGAILEARVRLERGDGEECLRLLRLMGQTLSRIRAAEALSLGNII